jgi:hypothetical protein
MEMGLPDDPVKAWPCAKSICMTIGVETIPTIIIIVARIPPMKVNKGE